MRRKIVMRRIPASPETRDAGIVEETFEVEGHVIACVIYADIGTMPPVAAQLHLERVRDYLRNGKGDAPVGTVMLEAMVPVRNGERLSEVEFWEETETQGDET